MYRNHTGLQLSNDRHLFFRAAGLYHHRIVNRSISHPAVPGLGSIQYLQGGYSRRHNGQRERHYTIHDMVPNLPHSRNMLGFMHETLPALPLCVFASNQPDSLPPRVSLPRVYTLDSRHQECSHNHYPYTRRPSKGRMEPEEPPTLT